MEASFLVSFPIRNIKAEQNPTVSGEMGGLGLLVCGIAGTFTNANKIKHQHKTFMHYYCVMRETCERFKKNILHLISSRIAVAHKHARDTHAKTPRTSRTRT